MVTWTGYLDAAGGDYSAGGLILTVDGTSDRIGLTVGYMYLLTSTIDLFWAHGGDEVAAGIDVAGSGLLVRGAGVVLDATAAGLYVAAVRAGSTDGVLFLQRRNRR